MNGAVRSPAVVPPLVNTDGAPLQNLSGLNQQNLEQMILRNMIGGTVGKVITHTEDDKVTNITAGKSAGGGPGINVRMNALGSPRHG